MHASYTSVSRPDGTPSKVISFARDVTEQEMSRHITLRNTTGIENSSSAMMAVDRDFIVTDINASTTELMARSADVFAQVWPDFDPENIIGTCIDQLHKKPAHHRKLLPDLANLLWKTDITIGDFKFPLNVNGIFDESGAHIDNLLEWDDVTEARLNTGTLEAIDRLQASVEFATDGTITNTNMLALSGYTLHELVDTAYTVLAGADSRADETSEAFWAALGEGETEQPHLSGAV